MAIAHSPVQFPGVTVSSTFTDLKEHRAALMKMIESNDLHAIAMDHDSAMTDHDVLDSSLKKVRDGTAYVGVISHRYGQIPDCPDRNPDHLSITELEFNEALRLDRPILLFIMGDGHFLLPADIERDPVKFDKLCQFRERAKLMRPGTLTQRVFAVFESLEQFKEMAAQSVGKLRATLAPQKMEVEISTHSGAYSPISDAIPRPPALDAEPAYIGAHRFVGRQAQLDTLNDWAGAADSNPVLLFEAIGGTGKSMLTWEWTTNHATSNRGDWAGRFWYSFYERGAVMADFCRRALAYMTERPLAEFAKLKTPELSEVLLRRLNERPWLLVLDGLERVLVAYHRFDAAQVKDDEAGKTDEIQDRNPTSAIRPEDEDLLRSLVTASPSKILITTRLTPKALLNPSNLPIPGVRREVLPGLRRADAEALFNACGVTGDSKEVQDYLQRHCDCHPLATGIVAGLVANWLPEPGNFDKWRTAESGGAKLNFGELDLVQKRNHILVVATGDLSSPSRKLLGTLALLSDSVDYPTIQAFNAHSPKKQRMSESELEKAVGDLKQRGLLQFDPSSRRYDLHPVVRGVAVGGLGQQEKETFGKAVVDHFSSKSHPPYEDVETLEEVEVGLNLVRTYLQMGMYQEACNVYRGALSYALLFNLEANAEIIALLRPFFSAGWDSLPPGIDDDDAGYLANVASIAFASLGYHDLSDQQSGLRLRQNLLLSTWARLAQSIANIAWNASDRNHLADESRLRKRALELASVIDEEEKLFRSRLDVFISLTTQGRWSEAEEMWALLDPMGRDWQRAVYQPGYAEFWRAQGKFWQGQLGEAELSNAEILAKREKNRRVVRWLHRLRGEWHAEREEWMLAMQSLGEAVRMAREVGQSDGRSEALLALAKYRLGQLVNPVEEAERLTKVTSNIALAELWLSLGEEERAKEVALERYEWAWADGEPYVRRYELDQAKAFLEKMGEPVPVLPPYDPSKVRKYDWEDEVVAAIDKLKAEKA